MIITVTLNPAIDKTVRIDKLVLNGLNRLDNIIINAGGKGINVSKTLQQLDAESIATGFCAGSNGSFIISALNDDNIKHEMVTIEGNTRINLKLLDATMNLTELNESGPTICTDDINRLKNTLAKLVHERDIVVFSGSAPIGVQPTIYEELATYVKQKGARVIIDADKELFANGIKAKPMLIKPNKYELCQYFNLDESIEDEVIVEKAKLFITQGIEHVVISMGAEGAYFLSEEAVYYAQGLQVEAHSSVGAGDAMIAAFAFALDHNYGIEEMIKLSVACSAGAVETRGTMPATWKRIKELEPMVKIEKYEGHKVFTYSKKRK